MNKNYFPNNSNVPFMQTNRSDDLGSVWATFNCDFQSNLGNIRIAPKLVANVTSDTVSTMKMPVGFEYFAACWFAVTGGENNDGVLMKNNTSSGHSDLTKQFIVDPDGVSIGSSTSQFDVTNTGGTTYRYTWDGTGTNPSISTTTVPVGSSVTISATASNFSAGNRGTFTVTGSGANYFEVTNASGVVESNKTIGSGYISVLGGPQSNSFGFKSDVKQFGSDTLYVTSDTKIYKKNGTLFAPLESLGTLSSGAVHQMAVLPTFNRLYFGYDTQIIRSMDISETIATEGNPYAIDLELTDDYAISCICATDTSIFIGLTTNSVSGITTKILEWDGISAKILNHYEVKASSVFAMEFYEGVLYAFDSNGRVLQQTGYSFKEVGRLPIDRYTLRIALPFMTFNGLKGTKNNTLLANVSTRFRRGDNPLMLENMPSGIWEIDIATGSFTHKYGPSYKGMESSTITDYGQMLTPYGGAVAVSFKDPSTTSYDDGVSTILSGMAYYSDNATTIKYGIFIDSPANPLTTNYEGLKRGHFVQTFYNSNEIENKWARLYTVFKKFTTSGDKIVCKYRFNDEDPIITSITWTSTTTFTTTTDISAYAPTATGFDGTTGGEVMIVAGTGGGACVHITNVSESLGTYTVTIDEALTGVTGSATGLFQKWVKINTLNDPGLLKMYQEGLINKVSPFIQIKTCLVWTGDGEFKKSILTSSNNITAQL